MQQADTEVPRPAVHLNRRAGTEADQGAGDVRREMEHHRSPGGRGKRRARGESQRDTRRTGTMTEHTEDGDDDGTHGGRGR